MCCGSGFVVGVTQHCCSLGGGLCVVTLVCVGVTLGCEGGTLRGLGVTSWLFVILFLALWVFTRGCW